MKFLTAIAPTIGMLGGAVLATMSPANLQDTANSLARQAFDAKDLVLAINSTKNGGPMQDVFEEMDDLYETTLANIQLVIGSATLTEESQDVQLVFEAYSYLVQGIFELMDSLGGSAVNFIAIDKQNEFRVPASIREVGGVIDAWMFNMIGLFPSNSSYADESANQKNQVDSHFRRSIAAYHLATAKTDSPYGNITNIVSADALAMSSSTKNDNLSAGTSNDDGVSSNLEAGNSDNTGTPNDITSKDVGTSGYISTSSDTSTSGHIDASSDSNISSDITTSGDVGASNDIDTSNNIDAGSAPKNCTSVETKIVTRWVQ